MIICPSCKEEIDDNSHYCDQCGQALLYCNRCQRVGIGRRCTHCGGLMITPDELARQAMQSNTAFSGSFSTGFASQASLSQGFATARPQQGKGMPLLTLYNDSLNIRLEGINGAVIGRRQGPYTQYFAQNMYVSGVHAQLKYNSQAGWSIVDKHSSNGTRLNQHSLQPDVEMSLKSGDIVTIANVSLQVNIH